MNGIREVEYTDLEAVARLMRREGWGVPTESDWRWLWQDNPAMNGAAPARGWVLLAANSVVGFLGNVVQQYQLGSRRLLAATAAGLVVEPPFRGSSLQLMVAHANQRGIDLLLNTTAVASVSRISEFLKFRRIPQPEYDRSFFWVLRPEPFARAALVKKGFRRGISRAAAPLAALAVRADALLRRRGARAGRSDVELRTIRADAVGTEFDSLWDRIVSKGSRLLARRDARTLGWHFGHRGGPHAPFFVCAYARGRLVGYVAVVRQDAQHLGLHRARVADLLVQDDDANTIAQLFRRACAEARRSGASMIEVVGFPAGVRTIFRSFRPRELVNESWPFLYKANDPDLQQMLAGEDVWYASLFDGDGSL